jgi:hypothetical protein
MLEKDVITTFCNRNSFFFQEFSQVQEEGEKFIKERAAERLLLMLLFIIF